MNKDITYFLPEERIALQPASPRDSSRLLVLHLKDLKTEHRVFRDIGEYFSRGDVFAVNNSRVIGARLYGKKSTGGSVEFLLLDKKEPGLWEAMGRPASRLKKGMRIAVEGGAEVEILEKKPGGFFLLKTPEDILDYGNIPLPPYIAARRPLKPEDSLDYQSCFARINGSVAAPTASLHFTRELIDSLEGRGVGFAPLTLLVGPGTFRPSEKPSEEVYDLSASSAEHLSTASRICVTGTTVMRTLETIALERGRIEAASGRTGLYIRRGHKFRAPDMFLTNFHLPSTPLLELVAAFIEESHPGRGMDILLDTYRQAIEKEYRFLSYGDAMLIIPPGKSRSL